MNDIRNITDKIISDAQILADAAEQLALAQAEEILRGYREKADRIRLDTQEKAKREAADALSRAESSHKMRERNILLEAKCRLLDEVFERAAAHFYGLESKKYTKLLMSFFDIAQTAHNSVLFMNKKDLKTVGNNFYTEAKKSFTKKNPGFTLTLSGTPVNIDGGFIIKNGDIELNCSISGFLSDFRQQHENDIFRLLLD